MWQKINYRKINFKNLYDLNNSNNFTGGNKKNNYIDNIFFSKSKKNNKNWQKFTKIRKISHFFIFFHYF